MSMKVVNEMALSASKPITVMLLEPYAGKLARTVLRGESSRKGADLLDSSGDPDTGKTARSWFGACVFLIVAATVLRSFFL
ncbi:DUF4134 domain-containing protein [Bacteroides xylanisolvens]|nr:DUF4134 domain-containing protein [Bacteroides xylanisolvens]